MAISRGAKGLSYLPSCFESILGVTVESVQGSQVYLEWIGTSGTFGMGATPAVPLECQVETTPLEVWWECRDSCPVEAGKWTLIPR